MVYSNAHIVSVRQRTLTHEIFDSIRQHAQDVTHIGENSRGDPFDCRVRKLQPTTVVPGGFGSSSDSSTDTILAEF